MKADIHPKNYRLVVFKDMSCDHTFLAHSCVDTKETINHEGQDYPLYKLEISSQSHPFYTGKQNLIDTAGRIDRFMKRYGKKAPAGQTEEVVTENEAPAEEA
jgi:large subunit ribosomal protein L31